MSIHNHPGSGPIDIIRVVSGAIPIVATKTTTTRVVNTHGFSSHSGIFASVVSLNTYVYIPGVSGIDVRDGPLNMLAHPQILGHCHTINLDIEPKPRGIIYDSDIILPGPDSMSAGGHAPAGSDDQNHQ